MMISAARLSDWLSPILVKELRQRLRSKAFVGSFLLLHVLMIVAIAVSILALKSGSDMEGISVLFWVLVAIPIALIMPASGATAISEEKKLRTLELILLTRLSAYRIVLGKWASIVFQSLLITTSVLPYVVLRYYLGGIELWSELMMLSVLLGFSVLLTALSVATSALVSNVIKGGVALLALYCLGMFIMYTVSRSHFGSPVMFSALRSVSLGVCLASFVAVAILLLLEGGAVQIGPMAENRSTRVRLTALVFLVLMIAVSLISDDMKELSVVLALIITVPVCLGSMCEHVREVPSIYIPFVRRGRSGTLFGRFFYPGWVSGLLFFFVMFAMFFLGFTSQNLDEEEALALLGVFTTILFPAVILKMFLRSIKKVFSVYMLIQVATIVPLYIFAVADAMGKDALVEKMSLIMALFPMSFTIATVSGAMNDHKIEHFWALRALFIGLSFVIIGASIWLIAAFSRDYRKLEARALKAISQDK